MTEDASNVPSFREISLGQLLERARLGWRTPIAFTAIAIFLAIIGLPFSRPIYLVEMSVVPAPSSQAEAGMTSSGGIGALLGIMGGQENSSYNRYQKLLTSTAVAERLQQKYDMLHIVFSDMWTKRKKNGSNRLNCATPCWDGCSTLRISPSGPRPMSPTLRPICKTPSSWYRRYKATS